MKIIGHSPLIGNDGSLSVSKSSYSVIKNRATAFLYIRTFSHILSHGSRSFLFTHNTRKHRHGVSDEPWMMNNGIIKEMQWMENVSTKTQTSIVFPHTDRAPWASQAPVWNVYYLNMMRWIRFTDFSFLIMSECEDAWNGINEHTSSGNMTVCWRFGYGNEWTRFYYIIVFIVVFFYSMKIRWMVRSSDRTLAFAARENHASIFNESQNAVYTEMTTKTTDQSNKELSAYISMSNNNRHRRTFGLNWLTRFWGITIVSRAYYTYLLGMFSNRKKIIKKKSIKIWFIHHYVLCICNI